jgi:hypothetical protein
LFSTMLIINLQHACSRASSGSSCIRNAPPLQAHPVLDKTGPVGKSPSLIY